MTIKVRVKEEALAGAEEQTVFGKTAKAGEYVEIDDRFAAKVAGNQTLETQGKLPDPEPDSDDDDAAPRRRGRPPAAA